MNPGMPSDENLASLAIRVTARFPASAAPRAVTPLGRGLINDSFLVVTERGEYVLQRINSHVFPWPERIMANWWHLQAAAHAAPNQAPRLPRLYPAADGQAFARDAAGDVWRLMEFVADSQSLTHIEHARQAREIGHLLGAFHRFGAALDCGMFALTLPELHRTPDYWTALCQAREQAPRACATAPDVVAAFDFLAARAPLYAVLENACIRGEIRQQVIHGDPKLDNLLFDRQGERALEHLGQPAVGPVEHIGA